jgi:hypothetical protein
MNTSLSVALMMSVLCLSLQSPARAESHATSKATTTKVVETKNKDLKGSKQLVNNDNLIPTQNRTQAMAVESTTGHLPGNEDAMLAKKKSVTVKTKAASKSRKHYVRTRRGMSHAAIRRGVLEAARGR